jgi:starvation-inducible DNA-binding protein
MRPNLGISDKNLQTVSEALNKLLADEMVLYIKAKNCHWNIEGLNFAEMHLFFEKQFQMIDKIIDEIAERVRTIGHFTEARLSDYLKLTSLVESPYSNDQTEQLKQLLAGHETIIHGLRRLVPLFHENHDFASSDFVTRLLGKHEKMAWMVRAYLGG